MPDLVTIQPLSVTVDPGTSVTVVLPPTLNTAVGSEYEAEIPDIAENHVGTEEIIISVSASTLPAVDRWRKYVTSQMLYNVRKCSPNAANRFKIRFIASGTETAVEFVRGLAPRKTTIAVVEPPTP